MTHKSKCTCEVCQYRFKARAIIRQLKSQDDRAFMTDMLDRLATAETDRDWAKEELRLKNLE